MCSSASRITQRGFTIVELLVSALLGLMILAIAAESAISNQKLYQKDLVRTRVNQDVRSALDILGMNIRQAGENLVASFPAVEIISGVGSAPDTLVLRRNLLDAVLNLCTDVAAGSTVTTLSVATAGATTTSCIRSNQLASYGSWSTFRTANGNSVRGYLFNTTTKEGEYFNYNNEADTGSALNLTSGAKTWTYSYPVGASALYILEEWRFSIVTIGTDQYLQLIEDGLTASPLNVVHGVTDFQISVVMQDGSTMTAFAPTDPWTSIRNIGVQITGQEALPKGGFVTRQVTGRFFPRNILSW